MTKHKKQKWCSVATIKIKKKVKIFKDELGMNLEQEINRWIRGSTNCNVIDIFSCKDLIIVYYEVKGKG